MGGGGVEEVEKFLIVLVLIVFFPSTVLRTGIEGHLSDLLEKAGGEVFTVSC